MPAIFLFIEHHLYSKEKRLQLTLNGNKWDKETVKPDLDTTIPNQIEERLNSDSRFILLVGLGGLRGSYWTKEIACLLKEKNKEFGIVCTLPFSFEESRTEYAKQLKDELLKLPNVYFLPNDTLREKYGNIKMKKHLKWDMKRF